MFNKPYQVNVEPKQNTQPVPEAVECEDTHKCFVNDLTDEERERAVAEYSEKIRQQLKGDTISVNCMSRLLNMAHPKVSALLSITSSARETLLSTSNTKMVRAKSLLEKLTPSERELLVLQLQKGNTPE